ncbi:MAG: molecular chaperone DnaK [Okeania sp. SIO3I5]|uniref:molecular chaperone DnaK n=1 Tax=Okeania sp. SIO3I5 TaxID=2607805 RepID=UPI0013BAF511|nr:molecular chaperone DnaK [Okeania sp. SIO3I5]NEQ39221.1 molecular chaperone DnaK [Okeania sp. SIO3I5]
MAKIIGIDLGTTNSLVAVMEGEKPTIIPNLLGNRITPSVVRILENGNYIVGENAAKALTTDPKNTIAGIKRFMGRRYNEVMDIVPTVPFDVVLGRNNFAMVRCHGVDYSPLVISAMILQYLKASAEAYLGEVVTQAVITVPAYFSDRQRQATVDAGEIAGLEVLRIINEPTAASLAYGLDRNREDNEDVENIIVFDLGGGTFDINILEVGDGVFEVLAHKGDGFLGGDDFDNAIIDWILEEIKLEYGVNLSNNVLALQRIAEVAKQAKCELSGVSQTQINIPYLIKKDEEFINLELILTRTKFEEICEELFERLIPPSEQALKDAKLSSSEIDKVVLVGGATRMKKVSEIIQRVFNTQPSSSVNPDEAVALGAAIQAGVLGGKVKDVLLLDTTPHSLGIEAQGGVVNRIIPRNTTIPTKKSEVFSTLLDGQTSVEIHILEGEGELAIDNRTLGRFILDRIFSAPRGIPQIEVTFDIDANGILNVTAKDKGTGKEQSISVELRMSKDEIEVMSNILDRNAASIKKMQLK